MILHIQNSVRHRIPRPETEFQSPHRLLYLRQIVLYLLPVFSCTPVQHLRQYCQMILHIMPDAAHISVDPLHLPDVLLYIPHLFLQYDTVTLLAVQ